MSKQDASENWKLTAAHQPGYDFNFDWDEANAGRPTGKSQLLYFLRRDLTEEMVLALEDMHLRGKFYVDDFNFEDYLEHPLPYEWWKAEMTDNQAWELAHHWEQHGYSPNSWCPF